MIPTESTSVVLPTKEAWHKYRVKGIGASVAASIVGLNPHKTNRQLWLELTGRAKAPYIGDKPYVQYGIAAEPLLREMFKLDFPEYKVNYEQWRVYRNKQYPFILATLDGELIDPRNRNGVWECKTTEIFNPSQWEQWKDRVPDNYYVQVLHQLIATGWDFSILKAQIRFRDKSNGLCISTRHYHFERSDVMSDMEYLLQEEIKFWECVEKDKEPPLILPKI